MDGKKRYESSAIRLLLLVVTLGALSALWLAILSFSSLAEGLFAGSKLQGDAEIGGQIWSDTNGNGARDLTEDGIPDVAVSLLGGTSPVTVTTSADGVYLFSGLDAGTYTVAVSAITLPGGSRPTSDPDGLGTPDMAVISVSAAQTKLDADFGYQEALHVAKKHWLGNRQPTYSQRYDIDITNTSAITLTTVQVVDKLPDMLRFSNTNLADGTPTGGVYDAATHQITWTLGALGPMASVKLGVFGYVNGSAIPGTEITNEVAVSSTQTTRATAEDTFLVVAAQSTPTPTATRTPTATSMPADTATPTVTATRTATATATPLTDLTIYGNIMDADAEPSVGIPFAHIALISCLMERFEAQADQSGAYVLVVPLDELETCTFVELEASADGYETLKATEAMADLLAQPMVNFWLPAGASGTPTMTPEAGSPSILLPLLFKLGQ